MQGKLSSRDKAALGQTMHFSSYWHKYSREYWMATETGK